MAAKTTTGLKAKRKIKTSKTKMVAGALERCDLPDLGIHALHARVDTGAATSSLHVDNMEEYKEDGKTWVAFDIHPDIYNVSETKRARARVRGRKRVKSSSADTEKRVVIHTRIRLGRRTWRIKLTLTNRKEMTYLMLLGREAMNGRIIVDPEHEYILS